METITLNDGTIVDGTVLENGDGIIIFVYLKGMTVLQGVLLFSDTEKSERFVVHSHGVEHIYEGFTEIYAASHEFGNCNLTMRKVQNAS